jgi:hypothetical protein
MQVKGFDSEIEVDIDGPVLVPDTAQYTAHVREVLLADTILATLLSSNGSIVWVSSVANSDPQPGFEFKTRLRFKFAGSVTKIGKLTRLLWTLRKLTSFRRNTWAFNCRLTLTRRLQGFRNG